MRLLGRDAVDWSRLTTGAAMISSFRTVAAVGVAALILVGGATLSGTMAQAEDDHTAPPVPNPSSERALLAQCSGGAATKMSSRAMDFQSVSAGATEDVEGSQWVVKGPKRQTDAVLVTLTSMSSSGGAGELLSIALYKDGVGTSEGTKYLAYNNVLDQTAVQFCTKIGKGQHTLVLKVTDGGGGAATMYYPTVTYQRFS